MHISNIKQFCTTQKLALLMDGGGYLWEARGGKRGGRRDAFGWRKVGSRHSKGKVGNRRRDQDPEVMPDASPFPGQPRTVPGCLDFHHR